MSAEIERIAGSDYPSENSFQPQAVFGRRRPRNVKERRVDRRKFVHAAQRRQAARCRRTNLVLRKWTMNDRLRRVRRIMRTARTMGMRMLDIGRMIGMLVMAQTSCQRPCNPAINEKKRKQNDSGAFHGSKCFLPSAPLHYKRRSEIPSSWTTAEQPRVLG